jgi:Xaa-Pro aminopeptidase
MDTLDTQRSLVRARIAALRAALGKAGLAAWVVPSSDPHLSEYLPDHWQGRQWLSGFTGSVGTLIVTREAAGLWIDSRYWVMAQEQLAGTGIELMKVPGAASSAHVDWLCQTLPAGSAVGVDGAVLSMTAARMLQSALAAGAIRLDAARDLLDEVWTDRPALPSAPLYEHVAPYAATARADKLALVRAEMRKAGATHHLLSTLDDLAWLLNLRGADVPYNPVFLAHALLDADRVRLFVAEGKVAPALAHRLARDGVTLEPYARVAEALRSLPEGATLLVDPRRVTCGLRAAVAEHVQVVEAINPSTLAKSRKSAAEIEHVRRTMEYDGAALAEFFAWFETALDAGERITELTIDEQITAARARQPGFVSPSFPTIAGWRANGAMPHYRASAESHALICDGSQRAGGLLLIDSGGQYLGGTTDITRVVAVGAPSEAERADFTRVLKGMIALSRTVFPRGTRSPALDAIARAPIWAAGIDYGHGTGHGVGYFLNVHEGPHGISPHLPPEPQTAMEPGMITSNEPGIYRPGRWGVRIENLILSVPADTGAEAQSFGEFLRFETLTLCPIDTRCIDRSLLSRDEVDWLDAYHAEVQARVSPLVDGAALAWLEQRTQPLD